MLKTLKGKISVVYIGLVFLIAIVGMTSVINLIHLEKSVNALMTRNYKSISSASEMMYALDSQDKAIVTYLNIDESKGFNDFYSNEKTFREYYDVDAHNVTESGEQNIVNSIDGNYDNFEKMFTTLVSIKKGQGISPSVAYYNSSIKPDLNNIKSQIRSLISINQNAMFNSKNEASSNAKFSSYVILLISLIAVTGGFLVSRFFVNRFLKPINKLTVGISKVRAGGLDFKLDIHTSDETGRLATEFNEMTQRLSVYEKSTMGTLVSERNKSVAIVKSISDPLIVLDNNFRIVLLNNASENFFKIKEDNVLSRHFLEAIQSGKLFDLISQSAQSGQTRFEKIMHFGGDEKTYYNVVITKIFDPNSNISGYILLMQNVTELKELEKLKTDFMATVSHEFKTPLTSIIMGASMLEDGSLGKLSDEQMETLKAISEDGERLSNFVNELLEISRMEAGKSIFRFESCSVAAIAENSCRQFRDFAQSHSITLSNSIDDSLPNVNADFEKLTWVLNNLIGNALKYTGAGDMISVTARALKDSVEVSVKDTGEGIPEEYLERIFDRFVQVQNRDIEVRGTGLGLSVAKEIIAAHGGTISVESELDVGSTFHFTIPLFKEKEGV